MDNLVFPQKLCLSPDGSKLFVMDQGFDDNYGEKNPRVEVLHANDGTYVQTIGGGGQIEMPIDICTSRDGRELFVIDEGMRDTYIKVFNTSNGTLSRTINCHRGSRDICVSDDKLFYFAEETIFVLNSTDGTHIQEIYIPCLEYNLRSICISQNDELFAVCNREIVVMDLFGTHLQTIVVDENLNPFYIRVSRDTLFALCGDLHDGFITYIMEFDIYDDRIDVRTIDTIEENGPFSLCASSNRELFVAYPFDKLIKVLQI